MTVLANKRLEINDALLAKLKLTRDEYKKIVKLLNREPNEVELHMFSVMWSEHCAYKNSKALLRTLPTKNKFVAIGPGENAGVVDLGEDLKVAFKIESHNRPTAVEPFQGAATGVGGILRDIFTMGARPVAILDSLRFGDIKLPRTRYLFSGAVSGISHYGNCTGVPNIGGEAYFYPTYNENPLVNAMAIGVVETKEIVKSGASGVGNPVLYVGSKTGRDGLGGASFASSGLTEKSHEDRPAVQVGDPFTGKILIEACLEAFKTGYVVAAQDMGAAGLTCSISEMAAKGGVGIEIDLNKVPIRTDSLKPVEYMLSESQERMLFVVKNGFDKEELLRFAAYAESHSNHPIAKSVIEAYGKLVPSGKIDQVSINDVQEISGKGISAKVNGQQVIVGNDKLLHLKNILHDKCEAEGTVIHIAVNSIYAGYIIISDTLKDGAQETISLLKKKNINSVMLTGDNKAAAEFFAKRLGIDKFYYELLPEDKVNHIEQIIQSTAKGNKVAFVGDGINDAPVLARADVGIAMGALGSDAAVETADVVLMTDSPLQVVTAIDVAKKTRKIVWQNIFFALGVKMFFIILGAFGIATMWEAVFGDMGVAVLAILNAMRVLK